MVWQELELSFSRLELRELCEDEGTMVARLGGEVARDLMTVLADMRASSRVSDLVNIHTIHLPPRGELCLSFSECMAVFATANHLENPMDKSGRVDWSAVSRLKIESIGANK